MQTVARGEALLVAVLFSLLVLTGCGSPAASRAAHMQRGQRYLAENNLQKAQVEFRNAMQIAPNQADARVMSGRVAEQLGNVRDALALYQSAIDVDAGYVPARVRLGRLYVLAAAPSRALETIAPALLQHPDDADLMTVRAAARSALMQREPALADAERAVSLAPQNEDAVALLAALYRQDGNVPRAVELLRTTLEKRTGSTDLRQILADLYEQLGQKDLAEAQFVRLVELNPKAFAPRFGLASFYVRSQRLDAAEGVFREAIAAQPSDEQPKLAYVEFLASRRSHAEGEQAIAHLIEQNPADYDLLLARAALLQRQDQRDAAATAYRDIITRAGDHPQGLLARDRLAAILVTQRRFDEASNFISQVLGRNQRDADALELRANIALERGETAAAVTDLRTALRDQPRSTLIRRALARAYLADAQTSLAEETLEDALEVAPDDVAVRVELGQLYARTNRLDTAIVALEQAVRLFPQNLAAREALVRLYIAKPDAEAAQKAAQQMTAAAPGDWHGPYLEAVVAEANKRPKDAARDLERALILQPDATEALDKLSQLDIADGHADRALARVQSLVASRPVDASVHNLLGQLLFETQDTKRAVAELTRAMQLAPDWWAPYHNLGAVQLAFGDSAAAIRTYERGVTATHMEPVLIADLATLYERQGRAADAIRSYEAFCRAFPGIPFAANNLAMLLVTYDKDPASLERARDLTARFMGATNADLLDTAGWVRLKSGDLTTALPALEEAARRAPDSRIVRYHLGMAQLQAGQRDRARASLESAVAGSARFPGWDEARSALARLGS
jgi:tetratricopeptide (TPR) repeat protein